MIHDEPAGQVDEGPADFPLNTGSLNPLEMRLILDALDLDLTVVGPDRSIRYYSERYRIFSRTPDIIGTDVIACHSPETRAGVDRLMSELESGWRDRAEFLERVKGRLVHIHYVALRDEDGVYRGVLEYAWYADEETGGTPSG